MVVSEELRHERWSPDFSSSGQQSPEWTRVSFDGQQLCNSVEGAEWSENPVQVVLCEQCGHTGCASGGYVHLSRLGDLVIWSRPQINRTDDWELAQHEASLPVRLYGAVAFPTPQWAKLRALGPEILAIDALAQSNRRVLADAWHLSPTGPARVEELEAVIPMLRSRLVAADGFSADEAINLLTPIVEWLLAEPEAVLVGRIVSAAELGVEVRTLYFDGPHELDWPAFALLDDGVALALSNELVFVS